MEDQAFLPSYDLPPPFTHPSRQLVASLSQSSCVAVRAYGRERGRGWARSQIIRPQESLVLYKSFNDLCCTPNSHTAKEDTQILLSHVMDICVYNVGIYLKWFCFDFLKKETNGKLKSLNLFIITFLLYTVYKLSTQSTHIPSKWKNQHWLAMVGKVTSFVNG